MQYQQQQMMYQQQNYRGGMPPNQFPQQQRFPQNKGMGGPLINFPGG